MQNTNMLLGVQCFCHGKTGFYKVESRKISYTKSTLQIDVPCIIEDKKTKQVTITFN